MMMLRILLKIFGIFMMIASPVISLKALIEFFKVEYLHYAPSYPFGKEITDAFLSHNINYLASYTSEMLYIGLIFLVITAIIYLSMLLKSLLKIARLAFILGIIYFLYYYVK